MTNEEKIALFEKEIDYMEIENIKDFGFFFPHAALPLPE